MAVLRTCPRIFLRRKTILSAIAFSFLLYFLYLYISIPSPEDLQRAYNRGKDHMNAKVKDAHDFAWRNVNYVKNKTIDTKNKVGDAVHAVVKWPKDVAGDLADKALQLGFGKNYSKKFQDGVDSVQGHIRHAKESVLNKTWVKLQDFGVVDMVRGARETINASGILDLNLHVEKIQKYMNNITYMKQLKEHMKYFPTEKNSHIEPGKCNCTHMTCMCCVVIKLPEVTLDQSMCVQFQLLSKPRIPQIDVLFLINNKTQAEGKLKARDPQELCAKTHVQSVSLCAEFTNTTVQIDHHGDHKTRYTGCLQVTINFLQTLSIPYPIDCFKLPGEDEHHHGHVIKQGNFVP